MGAPTGTITFLFTDIEGSTRLWEEAPAAMRTALARHDEIFRTDIEAHGGYVFSTGGDGFAVAFARAGDAVAAALDAQAALVAEAWPTSLPLRVRMGLHTGEAEETSRRMTGRYRAVAQLTVGGCLGGRAVGDRDLPVHRHRGVDAAVAAGRGGHALGSGAS